MGAVEIDRGWIRQALKSAPLTDRDVLRDVSLLVLGGDDDGR